MTTKKIASELFIAYSTAKRGIQKVEALRIIKQVGEMKRDKIYCATEILDILEEEAKIKANFEES